MTGVLSVVRLNHEREPALEFLRERGPGRESVYYSPSSFSRFADSFKSFL
jgi:hypothetical protein